MVKLLSFFKSSSLGVVVLLILVASQLFANDRHFAHLDIRQGLSHDHVNAIYRDEKGFVWIGTESGLNRFDGYKVKIFRNDPSDSGSLTQDNVTGLFKMPDGKMGVITPRGACLYDPFKEAFSSAINDFKTYAIFDPGKLRTAVEDKDGNFWFLVEDQGLIYYNIKTRRTTSIRHLNQDHSTISSNNITAITQHTDGSYWIAHSNGLVDNFVFKNQRASVKKRLNFFYNHRAGDNIRLNCQLTTDSEGDIWVYPTNYDMGIAYLNKRQDKIHYLGKSHGNTRLRSDMITGVAEDNSGNIWIANGQKGIDVLNKKTFSLTNLTNNLEDERSLGHNAITSMLKDNDGILWLGTYKGGIYYSHENMRRFPLINRHIKPNGLPFDDVNAFVEDAKGNLWLGTNGGGLIYFDRTAGKFTTYRHQPDDPHSLSADAIVSLCLDHQNQLWIGTFLGGLNRFDGKKFVRYQHDSKDPGSLPGRSVWEIFEDSQHRLWLGTLDAGLCLFDPVKKIFTKYHHPKQRALYSTYVPAIFEDSKGNMWFGTSTGIDMLQKADGNIIHFEMQPGNPASIPSNDIFGILEDARGRIWVGSRGGLSLWQPKSNTFVNITEKEGLPHNAILSMLEDDHGRLWLGTPNGLSCATVLTRQGKLRISFTNYSEADGLQGIQYTEDAAFRTRAGELIFGGANGFNLFKPSGLGKNDMTPRLAFTDFQIFNRTVRPGVSAEDKRILPASVTTNPFIELQASDNVFSIEFAALSFIQPGKNQYKYKLEGFNNNWLTTDASDRKVTFTNLDAGDYTFRVIASNNDGLWNKKGIALHIRVLPPLWKSPLAYCLYTTAIILLLLAARRMIQERERMKFAITQTREEARRSQELDRMKTKFFTNVSHELRTPLSLILSPVEKLSESAVNVQDRRQFELIQRNAKRLLNLVNQLLDFRKLEMNGIGFQPTEGELVEFVKNTVFSFSDLSEKKDIQLYFHSNVPQLATVFDHDKLEKILFNLLSNAIKFTLGPGEVSVTINIQDGEGHYLVEIKVQDTGIGIPTEKQELIFERFFQSDLPKTIINQGSGIGLAITNEFVRIHGGSVRVNSVEGKGSTFIVALPLQKRSLIFVQEPVSEPVRPAMVNQQLQAGHEVEGKPLILIVEDNEDFRFYLKDNLKHSYAVIEAANGKDGWDKALEHIPTLIVTDIMMPGLNGLDFCKMIKSDRRLAQVPVILLTAKSDDAQFLEGFDAGADDYIPKPFNFQVLESRIRNLISSRQKLQALFASANGLRASEIEITPLDQQFLRDMVLAIERNISNADFTVVDLARELGVSRSQLFKKVQMMTDKSPLEVVREIRLQHAAQLLEKSQLSVSEIAYQVGFNNPKYFARYFRELYQVLPSEYASGKRQPAQY